MEWRGMIVIMLCACQPGTANQDSPSLPEDVVDDVIYCTGADTYAQAVDVLLEVGSWVEMTTWSHYSTAYRDYYATQTGEDWPYGEWHVGRADGFGLDELGQPMIWCQGFSNSMLAVQGQVWDEVRVLVKTPN